MVFASRFLEETSQAAAHQQEELLGEEDPRDLIQRRLGLAPQVQDGGSQEGHAQAEAEERAPVGEGGLQVAFQQRHDALVQQLHVAPADTPATEAFRQRLKLPADKVNTTCVWALYS